VVFVFNSSEESDGSGIRVRVTILQISSRVGLIPVGRGGASDKSPDEMEGLGGGGGGARQYSYLSDTRA